MDHKLSKNCTDFINDEKINELIKNTKEDAKQVREIISKSLEKKPLSVNETASLLSVTSPELTEEIFNAARKLKNDVYGNRIVIFAPLYIGNYCINDCKYCAFRNSLRSTVRTTLNPNEIDSQITSLINTGHKRLILVFGEHPDYKPKFIADTVKQVYSIKDGNGEIRRVNINAAPLNTEDYKIIKESGIGTYQIFQETYHHKTYQEMHPAHTHKGDYLYRLDGLTRAYEAGCDDVGIGALFGLYDYRFEVLALVTHSWFLYNKFGCGPHTISFPRIRPAHGINIHEQYKVNDHDFKKLVAILRLSVPYTGMILTARETPELRREIMEFGVSQIDAGTRIELGGYTNNKEPQSKNGQFQIGDLRSLDEIILDLINNDFVPSFCTSCYRQGRTGEQFMEFAIPGFIQNFCTPNALYTLLEYLEDYASTHTKNKGYELIQSELLKIPSDKRNQIKLHLDKIKNSNQRDIYL